MIPQNYLALLGALVSCFSCVSLRAAQSEPTPGEWKLMSSTDNVVIYRRSREGSGHNESKAIGEIAAPTAIVNAVVNDAEAYPRFMPYTVECRVLKKEGDSILAYQRISAPLISDRDYTIRVRTTSKTVEGGTSYYSKWETENALGPAERKGIVRVKLCEGSWLLEPVGPNVTRATYSVHTDSGGVLPAFVKNTGGLIGIRKIFTAIRKQVRDPKYKAEGGGRKTETK